MSRRCRVRSERFNSTQRLCIQEQLDRTQKSSRSLARAEIEAQHGTKAALLFCGKLMLRMALQSWIRKPRNLRLCREKLRNRAAILVMLLHAERQRLDA